MFEFFTTLFGGIFWGAKIGSDISKTKAFDKNTKIVKQAYETGVANHALSEVQRKCREIPSCKTGKAEVIGCFVIRNQHYWCAAR